MQLLLGRFAGNAESAVDPLQLLSAVYPAVGSKQAAIEFVYARSKPMNINKEHQQSNWIFFLFEIPKYRKPGRSTRKTSWINFDRLDDAKCIESQGKCNAKCKQKKNNSQRMEDKKCRSDKSLFKANTQKKKKERNKIKEQWKKKHMAAVQSNNNYNKNKKKAITNN